MEPTTVAETLSPNYKLSRSASFASSIASGGASSSGRRSASKRRAHADDMDDDDSDVEALDL